MYWLNAYIVFKNNSNQYKRIPRNLDENNGETVYWQTKKKFDTKHINNTPRLFYHRTHLLFVFYERLYIACVILRPYDDYDVSVTACRWGIGWRVYFAFSKHVEAKKTRLSHRVSEKPNRDTAAAVHYGIVYPENGSDPAACARNRWNVRRVCTISFVSTGREIITRPIQFRVPRQTESEVRKRQVWMSANGDVATEPGEVPDSRFPRARCVVFGFVKLFSNTGGGYCLGKLVKTP